jgi:hypothetical protein
MLVFFLYPAARLEPNRFASVFLILFNQINNFICLEASGIHQPKLLLSEFIENPFQFRAEPLIMLAK